MTQKKSQRMETLRKLAQWRERDAAAAMREQQSRLQVEEQQLQELRDYYHGYLNTIDQQKTLGRVELINYRNFCYQLAQTIGRGNQKIATLQQGLEVRKKEWLLRHNKCQVLEELIIRCAKEESQWLDGELQKEIDDLWQTQNGQTQNGQAQNDRNQFSL